MGHLFDEPIKTNHGEPIDEPAKIGPRPGTQEWARAKLAEIYKRVDTAGPNTYSFIRFREKLRNDVREMVWDQVGVLTIEKYVLNKIREMELGSIR